MPIQSGNTLVTTKTDIANMALSKLGSSRLQLSDITQDSGEIVSQVNLHYDATLEYLSRMHEWGILVSHNRLPTRNFEVSFTAPTIPTSFQNVVYSCKPYAGIGSPTYSRPSSTLDNAATWSDTQTIEYVTDRWIIYTNNTSDEKTAILEVVTTDHRTPPRSGWSAVSAFASTVTAFEVKEFAPQPIWEHRFQLPKNCVRVRAVRDNKDFTGKAESNIYWQMDEDSIVCNSPDIYIQFNRLIQLESYDTLGRRIRGEHDVLFRECFITLLASKLCMALTGNKSLEQALLNEFLTVHLPEAKRVCGFEQNQMPLVDSEWLEATYTPNSAYSNSYPPFSQTSYGSFE